MLLLLLLVASCAAIPQNVSEKMFTFPQETNTAHVRLTTSRQNLQAVTVCFRFFTDLTREYALFSLAVPSFDNGLLFYKNLNSFSVSVKNAEPIFEGLDFKLNKWHSVCGTWSAASGLVQLWLNGEPSSRKLSSTSNINGPIIIALGQEQDSHGGGFNAKQSFVGMMSDLHMWDYTLSPYEIRKYMNGRGYAKGNVLNWNSLDFQIIGRVLIENKQIAFQ
ncbi:serum amyloid P-component-like isoform X2 [Xiphophorus couchianus]|uniref:serum amyloid P-component-like isoform X2 n=1 Tax=Xiphophorus couchianus TaxID=32473 RepID=UPI001016303F|nr:serum amyloid P-component-like isoform X2 [Xiphophorus couchianus]